LHICSSCRS